MATSTRSFKKWKATSRFTQPCPRLKKHDVAFHFLNDLVDVAIEHRHRAEPLEITQSLLAVLGSPAPLRKNGPKGDVCEQHDRRAAGAAFQIVFKPFQLFLAKHAEAAFFDVHHIGRPTK